MPPHRLEPPLWLEPYVWVDLDETVADARTRSLRDLVVAHHAELEAIWRELTRRNATDWRGQKLGDFLTPAPARYSSEPQGGEEERQGWAFFALIIVALDAYAQRVRIDIVGDYDDLCDFEKTVIRVGRIVVPKGVDRRAFVHAMGVLHHAVNASVYLWGGRSQKSAARRLVGLLTGVNLTDAQAQGLVSKKVAEIVAALVRQDERDADWERLMAQAHELRDRFAQMLEDYWRSLPEPPEPPPEPAKAEP
jgi:hypothetical protein